jgi:cell shape-determining protein MreD
MRRLYLYFLILAVFLADQILSTRLFPQFHLTLIAALIFLLVLLKPPEFVLVTALVLGLVYDLTALNRFPFITLFLLFEVVATVFVSKKYVDFSNLWAVLLGISFFSLLKVVLELLLSGQLSPSSFLILILLANVFLGLVVFVIYFLVAGKSRIEI